jgi:hypothetical protein
MNLFGGNNTKLMHNMKDERAKLLQNNRLDRIRELLLVAG